MSNQYMRQLFSFSAVGIAFCFQCAYADTADIAQRFAKECSHKAKTAEESGKMTVTAKNGWLFLASELRHIAVGKFWGQDAVRVSRAAKPEHADPFPAIVDFNIQLKKQGIKLIFLPVPPKAVIYPDMLTDGLVPDPKDDIPRLDVYHQDFYAHLRKHSVHVIDLVPIFLAARVSTLPRLYCKQDAHWSGAGIELATKEIVREIRQRPWFKPRPDFHLKATERAVKISGNLRRGTKDCDMPQETIILKYISSDSGSPRPTIDPDSPVLLMGDSHTLVFHAGGDMHATGGGLPDHLAFELGCPVDLIGVRGSGATPARINLFRKVLADKSCLTRKKVVIWCVGAREFTESDGWRKIPVIK